LGTVFPHSFSCPIFYFPRPGVSRLKNTHDNFFSPRLRGKKTTTKTPNLGFFELVFFIPSTSGPQPLFPPSSFLQRTEFGSHAAVSPYFFLLASARFRLNLKLGSHAFFGLNSVIILPLISRFCQLPFPLTCGCGFEFVLPCFPHSGASFPCVPRDPPPHPCFDLCRLFFALAPFLLFFSLVSSLTPLLFFSPLCRMFRPMVTPPPLLVFFDSSLFSFFFTVPFLSSAVRFFRFFLRPPVRSHCSLSPHVA